MNPFCFVFIALLAGFCCNACAVKAVESSRAEAYLYFTEAIVQAGQGDASRAIELLELARGLEPKSKEIRIELLKIYYKANELEKAEAAGLDLLALDDKDPASLTALARIYLASQKIDKGLEVLDKALQQNPDYKDAIFLLGLFYATSKDTPKAINMFKRLEDSSLKDSVTAKYYLGYLYRDAREFENAIQKFRELWESRPDFSLALLELARTYEVKGDTDEAVRQYERYLEKEPDDVASRGRFIMLLLKAKRIDATITQLRMMKSSLPDETRLDAQIALLLLEQKKSREAVEALRLLHEKDPGNAQFTFYLAVALFEEGNLDEALELLNKIDEASEFYIEAQRHKVIILRAQNRRDEAIALLEGLLKKRPDTESWIMALIQLYDETDNSKKAEVLMYKALEANSDNIDLLFQRVMLLDKQGKKQEALFLANKLLEKDPEHPYVLNYIGYTYAEQGDNLEKAESMIKQALLAEPGDGYIMDSLSWVFYRKGDLENALVYARKAIDIVPNDPIIYEHLGDILMAMDKKTDALKAYQEAVKHAKMENDKQRIGAKISKMER